MQLLRLLLLILILVLIIYIIGFFQLKKTFDSPATEEIIKPPTTLDILINDLLTVIKDLKAVPAILRGDRRQF